MSSYRNFTVDESEKDNNRTYYKNYTETPIEAEKPVTQEMRKTEPLTVKGKIVNASLVNMRKSPAKIDNVIKTLQKGTEVTIIDESPNYYKIQVGDEVGYVASNFCERIR